MALGGVIAVVSGCVLVSVLGDQAGWVGICAGPIAVMATLIVATLVINDRAAK
ncbi:MAG: hypothetical protein H0U40_08585 [Chloroflexia bacterium]|nr:hypothetical protein [Chloroflexia bacterium]MDQ3512058.1 hypothetical protein [Chloroflexota bacterium]